jgi:hypothetical protein
MKAHITLSVRSALSLALGMILSATLATGCDSDDEPDVLELSNPVPAPENAAPDPVFQCQNGTKVSVWTKVPSPGYTPGVLITANADRDCPDASVD